MGEFFTDKYHYTIVDAPGHKDYIKNMITGSATADVGLLLVPAEKGGFEAAIAKADAKAGVEEGQTRRHARLLYLLGVDQIIVGINKMDACNWSQDRFTEIKDEFVKMLQMIGFKPKRFPSFLTPDSTVTTLLRSPIRLLGTRDGLPTSVPRRRSPDSPLLSASTTSSPPPSATPSSLFVFPFPTSTTSRVLVKLFAEPSNKELSSPVMKSELSPPDSKERRSFPSRPTSVSFPRPLPVTPLVFPSRVSPRTRRSNPVISSTSRRKVNASPSSLSLPWLLSKSTPVFSSLGTVRLFSAVPPRLRAK